MAYGKSDVSGVGGWLALFLFSFALVLPIAPIIVIVRSLLGTIVAFDVPGLPGWLSYPLIAATLCAGQVALCWLVAWRLLRVRRWSTVRLTIVAILIVCPGFVLIDMLAAATFFGVPVAALPRAYAGGFGRNAAYSILWIAYFLRSQRVANTYPRPTDEDRLIAVFN